MEQQQEKGEHNASQILREMVTMDFTGSETTVRDAMTKWRKGVTEPLLAALRLSSASKVSRWLMPWRIIRGGGKLRITVYRVDVRK
nr:hypothetical protein [Hafnia alvei]